MIAESVITVLSTTWHHMVYAMASDITEWSHIDGAIGFLENVSETVLDNNIFVATKYSGEVSKYILSSNENAIFHGQVKNIKK